MERYTMLLDWRNQYCENDYTTQSNLHNQCNLYKITNKIFNRTETNIFKNLYGIQKTLIAKAILRKKNGNRRIRLLTSDYTAKLQSSKQYGTGTKAELQIHGTGQKAQKQPHTPVINYSVTKEARLQNVEKTVSSISGAGKTGQLHVKIEIRIFSAYYITQKKRILLFEINAYFFASFFKIS